MIAKKNDLDKVYLLELTKELQYIEQKEKAWKRKIRRILYPLISAFVLLAGYGFYLIQSVTTDIDNMSASVVRMNESVSRNIKNMAIRSQVIARDMDKMIDNISTMSLSLQSMSGNMGHMTATATELQIPMYDLNLSTRHIQHNMGNLNDNLDKPLGMFNQFIPWGFQ